LLTGDIGKVTEEALTNRYENWDVDILKVPHHGSRYSSSLPFLYETMPEFAVIQVGKNAYGHPHDETRYRYYTINCNLLRTDYDGTLRFQLWNRILTVYASRSDTLYIHELK